MDGLVQLDLPPVWHRNLRNSSVKQDVHRTVWTRWVAQLPLAWRWLDRKQLESNLVGYLDNRVSLMRPLPFRIGDNKLDISRWADEHHTIVAQFQPVRGRKALYRYRSFL